MRRWEPFLLNPYKIPILPPSGLPLVIKAVQENRTANLKSLIKESANEDSNGFTALHYATCEGRNEMVQELLLAEADRTAVSECDELTVLALAIWNKHRDCISSLLSETFIVGREDCSSEAKRDFLRFVANQPSTSLRMAPRLVFPSVDVLVELLKAGAQVKDCFDSEGFLPIHQASAWCSREIVELLLRWGADPESLPIGDMVISPISFASLGLNVEAFKALIQAGADLGACINPLNSHPLQLVTQHLNDENRKELFERNKLRVPTKDETLDMMIFILDFPDVKIDHRDYKGNTALHVVSMESCKKAVDLLLGAGANPTVKNVNGRTPADLASDPAIRALLEAYQSDNSAHVIGYRNNVSSPQAPLKAIGFTRRKQCLASLKGAYIEPVSVDAGDQPEASSSKDQTSGISLEIPENSLSETVALTLNYTPNPPVLIQRQDKEIEHPKALQEQEMVQLEKALLSYESKLNLTEQMRKPATEIVEFTLPVSDTSTRAKETVISPFVTITANQPVTLLKDAHLTFPHCAASTQGISKSKRGWSQFQITINSH